MKSTLVTLYGCPYCQIALSAVADMNKNLPIGEKIRILEVFPRFKYNRPIGDPRYIAVMQGIYGENSDPNEWGFPALVLTEPKIKKYFNNYVIGRTDGVLLHSAFSHRHHKAFMSEYLSEEELI